MRLWSLHPSYLDAKGLTALWREALLARKVLQGKTRGYRHHPQLIRFRETGQPVGAVNMYLKHIHTEAKRRGFRFDASKLSSSAFKERIPVTRGQAEFELRHLKDKLKKRDQEQYRLLIQTKRLRLHPLRRHFSGS